MLTLPHVNLQVSFVISTYNRRDVLLSTLDALRHCGLRPEAFEVLVVDNASTDGTAGAVRQQFPRVRLFPLTSNNGSCAKNVALPHARGRFVMFLDDDSFPVFGSLARMIQHFDADPQLGAAAFDVHLPDGSRECSAYPNVFIGCGTGFRRRALAEVGGLPTDFFMQAEEYDLSLRLLDAGWRVRPFDDLHVIHLKSPAARRSGRTMRLDVRNNLIVASRYFPGGWAGPMARDWLTRYYRIAAAKRQRLAFLAGAAQGAVAMITDQRRPIGAAAFETFAKVNEIEARLRRAQADLDLRSVLFVDVGKNLLPYWRAARRLGILVVAIADAKLGRDGNGRPARYRGIPIVTDEEARTYAFDAAVVSNLSPVHAALRREQWRRMDFRPVIDLFEPCEQSQTSIATAGAAAAAAA